MPRLSVVPVILVLLGGFSLAVPIAAQEAPAGHSGHGEVFNEGPRQSAYLIKGCGEVQFPISCKRDLTQRFFNQGVGQLHGFWNFEAERSFRQAAAGEPGCAMNYWGMAMASVDNPDRAAAFMEQAVVRRTQANERDRQWIDMLAKYYEVTVASAGAAVVNRGYSVAADAAAESRAAAGVTEAPSGKAGSGKPRPRKYKNSKKKRSRDLVRGYEAVLHRYPDNIEAMAFLANRLWLNRRAGLSTNSHMVVEMLLRQVFAKSPNHPAHHYRIHLWDTEDAKRALVSARVSGQSAPAIAHQWHMSGHIFAKLHRHHDAVYQQIASARVDHTHMMHDGVMPYKTHNYGHNNEWLTRSLNHVGRPREALALAENMVELPRHPDKNRVSKRTSISGYGTQRLLDTCRNYHLASELHSLLRRGYLKGGDSERTRAQVATDIGLASLLMGEVQPGKQQIAVLEAMLVTSKQREAKRKASSVELAAAKSATTPKGKSKGKSKAKPKTPPNEASVKYLDARLADLRGLLAVCEGRTDDAAKLLKKVRLPKFCLAECYAKIGDHHKARELIDAAAKKTPNRAEVLARQVQILWAAGDRQASAAAFTTLRQAAGEGELDTPLFQALAPIAKTLGYPEDWRTPRMEPEDVGQRPVLSTLGPFRWQPSPAKSWRLPSADGGEVSLADYRGKPVLVIFYLGFGCLHCVEQLQHFHPKVEAFRNLGIEIVGIGTDTLAGMAKSLNEMSPEDRIGFPLLADPSMQVFKQWRTYDDFENLPLHGTFLIDGAGMVRWADISYEPFDQADYLLAECKRLLAQDSD